jgi:hypothetical protein
VSRSNLNVDRTPQNHPWGGSQGVIFDPILGPSFEGYMAKTPKVAPLNMGPPAKRGSKKVTILGHLGPSRGSQGVIFDPILGPSFEGYMAKTPKVAPLNMGPPAKRGSKKVTILGHLGPSWEGPRQAWEGQNDHFWGPKIGWF